MGANSGEKKIFWNKLEIGGKAEAWSKTRGKITKFWSKMEGDTTKVESEMVKKRKRWNEIGE